MGLVVLVGKIADNISGSLSTISGDLHVQDENLLIGTVAGIEGELSGDQINYATLTDPFQLASGTFIAHSSINVIEGELVGIEELGGFTATSNRVAIESELPGIEGAFYGGGAIGGELALIEGEMTGTVPVVGRIEHSGITLEGSMSCGAEINFTSVLLNGYMNATVPSVGRIPAESKLSVLTGSFEAIVPFGADLVGELQTLTGTFTAHTDVSSRMAGSMITLTGNIHAQTEVLGTLEGELPLLSGSMAASHSVIGAIEGELATLTSDSVLHDDEDHEYGILRFVRGETR